MSLPLDPGTWALAAGGFAVGDRVDLMLDLQMQAAATETMPT